MPIYKEDMVFTRRREELEARPSSARERFRRGILIAGVATTVFGVLHHTDHVIRGNHSGWPFQEAVTPFTFSLLIYALILPGLYLTARGRTDHQVPSLRRACRARTGLRRSFPWGGTRGANTGYLRGLREPGGGLVSARGARGALHQPGCAGDHSL